MNNYELLVKYQNDYKNRCIKLRQQNSITKGPLWSLSPSDTELHKLRNAIKSCILYEQTTIRYGLFYLDLYGIQQEDIDNVVIGPIPTTVEELQSNAVYDLLIKYQIDPRLGSILCRYWQEHNTEAVNWADEVIGNFTYAKEMSK